MIPSPSLLRTAIAAALALLVGAYTIAVLTGCLPPERQLGATHLLLIALTGVVIVLLVRPEALSRLKLLELSGFKLELLERMEKVSERQARQARELEDITLILPLLFPQTERQHLFNLYRRRTQGYRGNPYLRAELRRLRSIGLIEMCDNHRLADMANDAVFDLATYVKLTELGERWARRIQEIEKEAAVTDTE